MAYLQSNDNGTRWNLARVGYTGTPLILAAPWELKNQIPTRIVTRGKESVECCLAWVAGGLSTFGEAVLEVPTVFRRRLCLMAIVLKLGIYLKAKLSKLCYVMSGRGIKYNKTDFKRIKVH